MPAQAGIHAGREAARSSWTPACAGVTASVLPPREGAYSTSAADKDGVVAMRSEIERQASSSGCT
jgi:hypothetical protein